MCGNQQCSATGLLRSRVWQMVSRDSLLTRTNAD
jgi:hypothetical protein